ncbi:unnamed protein product, partial [marine sediment metagenome]
MQNDITTNIQLGKHDPLTKDVYWLTNIKTPKDERRPHIVNVYVKNGDMFRTDGHRLHRLKTNRTDFKDGFYQVLKRTKADMIMAYIGNDYSYPDCNDLLKKPSGVELILRQKENDSSKAFTEIIRAMDD